MCWPIAIITYCSTRDHYLSCAELDLYFKQFRNEYASTHTKHMQHCCLHFMLQYSVYSIVHTSHETLMTEQSASSKKIPVPSIAHEIVHTSYLAGERTNHRLQLDLSCTQLTGFKQRCVYRASPLMLEPYTV